jgi:hypothetical protein
MASDFPRGAPVSTARCADAAAPPVTARPSSVTKITAGFHGRGGPSVSSRSDARVTWQNVYIAILRS